MNDERSKESRETGCRRIWIIRHAKSSWAIARQNDVDRPLNERGQRDCQQMQTWLAEQSHAATWLWTSSAVRALATSDYVRTGFALAADRILENDALYGGSPEALLTVLRQTPSDIANVAVVAHNPGLSHLVNELTGEHVTNNLPTLGIARLSSKGSWQDLRFGQCRLEVLVSPKKLSSLSVSDK